MAKRRYNAGPYKYTPRRRAALKRAQMISARKRKGQRNRKIAVGVLAVAGIAGAAYAGHKYGGKAGSIASDLKGRFPKGSVSVGGITISRSARNVHQVGAKESARIANAISPASTPRIKVSGKLKPTKGAQKLNRTVVPTISKEAQKNLMARATAPKVPVLNEDGSVKQFTDRGIPKELIAGKPITARTAHGAISRNEKAKVKSGLTAKTSGQRRAQVKNMISEGTVQQATTGKKVRSKVKIGGMTEDEWNAALGMS